ncbi:MAG TPA: biotin-dependent carboxyltransferase family protein [Acetobacteraceae bacterium]|nr:biotin-dependent carboxyltransferase family protein [Acetobacteraceae bacterium]
MSAALRAVLPGPYVTIQDAGRRGWRRFGVSVSGAMDWPALALANTLVGNPPDTAALEFAHFGGTWEIAAESCRIAVTGGDFALSADGVALAPWRSHTLRQRQLLTLKGSPDAVWGYLAVAGGFDVTRQLGSCATHLRSGLGGFAGCRVAEGDVLPLRAAQAPDGPERRMAAPDREGRPGREARPGPEPGPGREASPVRVVLGPQDDFFTPDTIASFLATPWRVSHRGDRMGTWLEGPPIAHANGYNLLSDGLVPGCIQVPGSGQPVVLLMDCQTIGGFPKLATIITADLPRFTQCRPGSLVRFAAVDVEAAQAVYRDYRAVVDELQQTVEEIAAPPARPFWLRQ